MSPLIIQECLFNERITEIRKLRREVWASVPEFHNEYLMDLEHDDHDEHALHWVCLDEGEVVASARLCLHGCIHEIPDVEYFPEGIDVEPGTIACMSRLVVHPRYRRFGLGSLLTESRILKARAFKASFILVRPFMNQEARLRAAGFVYCATAKPVPCIFPIVEKFLIKDIRARKDEAIPTILPARFTGAAKSIALLKSAT